MPDSGHPQIDSNDNVLTCCCDTPLGNIHCDGTPERATEKVPPMLYKGKRNKRKTKTLFSSKGSLLGRK